MPDPAGMTVLVIGAKLKLLEKRPRSVQDTHREVTLNQAIFDRNDRVGTGRIKARNNPATVPADRLLNLITVSPGILHSQRWFYLDILNAPQAFQGFLNQLPLCIELEVVIHVLPDAAAARQLIGSGFLKVIGTGRD